MLPVVVMVVVVGHRVLPPQDQGPVSWPDSVLADPKT